jgi:hypothetical protein
MDRLTSFVALAHAQLRIEYLKRHPEILEGIEMTPKLAGLTSAMAKLRHTVETEADKLAARIEGANTHSAAAFQKAHVVIDGTERDVSEIEAFIASLEGSNGAPAGPLDGSSVSSEVAQPERLTANGVSVGG